MSSFGNELCIPISGLSGWVSKKSRKSWHSCHPDWHYFPWPSLLSPASWSLWLESHCNASMAQTQSPKGCHYLLLSTFQLDSLISWRGHSNVTVRFSPVYFCNQTGQMQQNTQVADLTFTHTHAHVYFFTVAFKGWSFVALKHLLGNQDGFFFRDYGFIIVNVKPLWTAGVWLQLLLIVP